MTQAARLGVGLLGTANLESAFLLPHLFLAHVIIFEKAIKDVSQPALVRFLRRAGKLAGVTGRVAVLIASNRSVRELNRRFRKKNQPTDVLSFPADRGGDIAIAAGMVRENARRYGHSPSQEIQILILHGLLHLAGYDHETDSGQMATRERRLRARLKLPESLIGRAPSRSLAQRGATRKSS